MLLDSLEVSPGPAAAADAAPAAAAGLLPEAPLSCMAISSASISLQLLEQASPAALPPLPLLPAPPLLPATSPAAADAAASASGLAPAGLWNGVALPLLLPALPACPAAGGDSSRSFDMRG